MGIYYIAIAFVPFFIACISIIVWMQKYLDDFWENGRKVPAYAKDGTYYTIWICLGITLFFEIIGLCVGI